MTFDPISFLMSLAPKLVEHGTTAQSEYRAKGRSLRTYPETLQKIYGRLNVQGLIGCNSIYLSDIFVQQNAMEYLNIGESKEDRLDDEFKKPEDDESKEDWLDDESKKPEDDKSKEDRLDDEFRKPKLVLNVLENHQRLVIFGEPGSGKSTLVRHLALDWAKWWKEQEKNDKFHVDRSTVESYCQLIQGKKTSSFQ